ncbi:MAG: hypothetical protein A2073_04990 [Deltaproteobacteria bacterium GWC2_42_11]|nr:MAG: hypothetical protein A2073_04990 [Deltaproteobacteria bacterium GWC2_42_11]
MYNTENYVKKAMFFGETHMSLWLTKGHENLVAACPAGKPFEWEVFRGYGFAGGAGSNSKKIFSGHMI